MRSELEKTLSEIGKSISEHGKRLRKLEVRNVPYGASSPSDITPPTVPTNLTATVISYNMVTLNWGTSTDANGVSGYTIYRNGSNIGSIIVPPYNDGTVVGGTSYVYEVDAFDFSGNHSAKSNQATATTPGIQDTQPPSTPAGLVASAITYSSCTISWLPSTDNIGVAGYTVYRNGTPVASPTQTTYSFSNLTPSSSYVFTVDAFDAAGNHSGQSSSVMVNTPAAPLVGIWFVSPAGAIGNNGTIDSPFTLDHALNGAAGGLILPGHTVYIRGGTYTITSAQVVTGLAGTAPSRITVKCYPGDAKVQFRNTNGGTVNTWELQTISYTDFYDMEWFSTGYTRNPEVPAGVNVYHIYENGAFVQSNVRFRCCHFSNSAGKAVGTWPTSDAIEYNGCIFAQNGSSKTVDWTIWAQSGVGKTKRFKDCVLINNSSDGIRVYSNSTAHLEGIWLEGDVIVGAGELYDTCANGFYCVGTTNKVQTLNMANNIYSSVYLSPGADIGSFRLGQTGGGGTPGTFGPVSPVGTDDGRWYSDGSYNATGVTVEMGVGTGITHSGWIRFPNVTIPRGSTIDTATMDLVSYNARAANVCWGWIRADKSSADPGIPATAADATGRARTTANVHWQTAALTGGVVITTPDFSNVVKEITDQVTWNSGQHLQIFLDGDNAGTNYASFCSDEHATYNPPILTITYTTPGGGSPTTATATFYGQASQDDGRWTSDGLTFNNGSGTLEIGRKSTVNYNTFLRFPNLPIPQGSTISSATITMVATNTRIGFAMHEIIRAENVDNSTVVASAADIMGRSFTAASSASWDIGDVTPGTVFTSPSISSVIQAIVNRVGWASGNAITLVIQDEAGTGTNTWWPASFDSTSYAKPQLDITYSYTTAGSTDAGADLVTMSGSYFVGAPVYIGASNYTNTTIIGNTFIYNGAQPTGSQSNFLNNNWFNTTPSTGVRLYAKAYEFDTKRGNLVIYNFSGAVTVTVSSSDLVDFTLNAGDQFTLANCENPFVDIMTYTYDGTSFTVPMTGRSMQTASGGIAQPTSGFPYLGVFRMTIAGGGTPPPPTGDTTPPTVPGTVTATAISASQIDLSWVASTDAVGVTGYTIYRNGSQLCTVAPSTSYSDTGLTASTLYTYTMNAYDAAGNHSAQSASTSATTLAAPPPPAGVNHYIDPSGSSANSGTRASPWSLSYVLAGAGGQISAGDVIYMMDGTYPVSQIAFSLSGTAADPIKIMAEPGARPIIQGTNTDTDILRFNDVAHVWFYDIVFTFTSSYTRTSQTASSSPGCFILTNSGHVQTNVKFFGCIFHNSKGMGIKWWEWPRENNEFNGCLVFMCGQTSQFDHNHYGHNNDAYLRVWRDCIFHNSASYNVHYYDDTGRPVNNVRLEGCVLYNPTSLYGGGTPKANMLMGSNGSDTLHGQVVNCFFYSPSGWGSGPEVRFGYSSGNAFSNATITGNFSVGRQWQFASSNFSGTINNNTIHTHNSLDGTSTAIINGGTGNVINSVPGAGTDVFLRTYNWNNKRGNLIIYNYGGSSSITLTQAQLTTAGFNMVNGNSYQLINTADPFSDVINGTYNGTSITVPMTGRTVMTPYGGLSKPANTFPYFGCFILKNIS